MFGTIIVDSYSKDEIDIIVDSLDEICSPNDFYGWSSAGIYSFWNYYTKEIIIFSCIPSRINISTYFIPRW